MQFAKKDIKDNTGNLDFKRGVDYYNGGKVLEYKVAIDSNTIYIKGKVRGSGGNVYHQDIDISIKHNEIAIEGECSCPMEYNCKHVVAVCLKYQEDETPEIIIPTILSTGGLSLVDKWLNNLENSISQRDKEENKNEIESGEYFLTYRLDGLLPSDNGMLSFYKSKRLKNGAMSKGTPLDTYYIMNDYLYSELKNAQDKNILLMASAFLQRDTYKPTMKALSGTLGAIILKEVISTERCYFDYHPYPLVLKEGVYHGIFEFKLYNGEYSLKLNVSKKKQRIIETTPLFLLDIEQNTVQEIDIDIKMYKELLKIPKIPKEDIGKVYSSLGRIEIKRDLDYEEECKETLETFGFEVEIKNKSLSVALKDGNRQRQLKVWRFKPKKSNQSSRQYSNFCKRGERYCSFHSLLQCFLSSKKR